MSLKRLTPVIKRYELGSLRLWLDDLAEIVASISQLNGAINVEADNYAVEDVENDLPEIGQRLNYFSVAVNKVDEGAAQRHLLRLRLSRNHCFIEAADPDAETRGIIGDIQSLAEHRRRLPLRLTAFVGSRSGPVLGILVLFTLALATGATLFLEKFHFPQLVWFILVLFMSTIGLLLSGGLLVGFVRSNTILFTETRAQAPTWWQEHRAEIAIHVVVGVVFFLLGLLAAHL
jgi:hypothetical protein